ncbi:MULTISPECIES: NAD(P)H-dependent oxidoreductase [Maribacter]|uniref:Nitroreductase / dihydropteridine reductase n=1 Tax=Maribacter stanieri TaxID=440514 RepID=A0A1I6KI06_9FLAO|nr:MULTISPECIES: NAD(P)H-dependent oxidoreductase [Maribacter]SFR90841.1 nitroreductase / dihydropteridine reductase [Maribacter stanieri]|tara:strand:+ start:88 stop:690 length:603 start_codon:yes stop_codon:yes gene_type:complete
MNFKQFAENRYTTKKYNTTRKVLDSDIQDLKDILKLSPSSINSQPWLFTFVSNEQVKNDLADASYFNATKIKDASHLVVFSVMDNLIEFEKRVEENLNEGAIRYFKQFVKPQPAEKTINWLSQQVYITLGFFLAACAAMEIDSTPMEGIEPEKYKDILKINDHKVLFSVAIGYRHSEDNTQPNIIGKSRLSANKVIQSID